jgi:hypothetical protein
LNMRNDSMNGNDFENDFENIKVVKLNNGKYAKYVECNDTIQILFAGRHLGRGYTARIHFVSRDEISSYRGVIDVRGRTASEIVFDDTTQYLNDLQELNELGIA